MLRITKVQAYIYIRTIFHLLYESSLSAGLVDAVPIGGKFVEAIFLKLPEEIDSASSHKFSLINALTRIFSFVPT